VETISAKDPLSLPGDPANLLAVLAHEMRGPLSAMSGAVQLLRLGGKDPDVRDFATALLDRQFKHMSRLVEDLTDLTLTRSGKLSLRKQLVNLLDVVQASVEIVRPLTTKYDLSFEVMRKHTRLQRWPRKRNRIRRGA
jgi:signal transduction histidine kinase